MLIEFRVENHRSLRDEQVLTMEAGRISDDSEPWPRSVKGHSKPLLPVVALYGANASGKSNVLSALAFMREAILFSHHAWSPEGDSLPREQFAWGPKHEKPSLFEVELLLGDTRYRYGFVASSQRFLEEWLHAWPKSKKVTLFERDCDKFHFGEALKGENKLIQEVTRPNALFLSTAAQHQHKQLQQVFTWFSGLEPVNLAPGRHWRNYSSEKPFLFTLARFLDEDFPTAQRRLDFPPLDGDSKSMGEQFLPLIKHADLGIVDIRIVKSHQASDSLVRRHGRLQLRHHAKFKDSWLPLEEESHGTQMLFRNALPILNAIKRGGVLLIDELEASMHPMLARQIVRLFNDPTSNPRNAQLIFTTHDTNLLGTTVGEPALRRDQVWLTEKDKDGATVLYPLTDYKPRNVENLERGYLQGRYGAIPFLGDFALQAE